MRPVESHQKPSGRVSRRKPKMRMRAIEGAASAPCYPELAGKRILITGLSSSCGVDIVRAFAEHKTRLILQFDEMSEKMQTIAEIAAPHALAVKAFGPVEEGADKAIRFNAIAPPAVRAPANPGSGGEPDIAALALYLASG